MSNPMPDAQKDAIDALIYAAKQACINLGKTAQGLALYETIAPAESRNRELRDALGKALAQWKMYANDEREKEELQYIEDSDDLEGRRFRSFRALLAQENSHD